MVGAPLFSQSSMCMQPPQQSPRKTHSFTSVNFHLPIPPLLDNKIIFTIPTNICSMPQQFFTSQQSKPKTIFPTSAI